MNWNDTFWEAWRDGYASFASSYRAFAYFGQSASGTRRAWQRDMSFDLSVIPDDQKSHPAWLSFTERVQQCTLVRDPSAMWQWYRDGWESTCDEQALRQDILEAQHTIERQRSTIASLNSAPLGLAVSVCNRLDAIVNILSEGVVEGAVPPSPRYSLAELGAVVTELLAKHAQYRAAVDSGTPNPLVDELVHLRDRARACEAVCRYTIEHAIPSERVTSTLLELIRQYNAVVKRAPARSDLETQELTMTLDPPIGSRPVRISEPHAVDQYIERHLPKVPGKDAQEVSYNKRIQRANARQLLLDALPKARPVPGSWEPGDLEGLGQGIWVIRPVTMDVKIVVDGEGLVRTVLPKDLDLETL